MPISLDISGVSFHWALILTTSNMPGGKKNLTELKTSREYGNNDQAGYLEKKFFFNKNGGGLIGNGQVESVTE